MRWVAAWFVVCLAKTFSAQVHTVNREHINALDLNITIPLLNNTLVPATNENSLINGDVNVGIREEEGQEPQSDSNEIPRNSEEDPNSSEGPNQSNEILNPSNEIPSPSNEVINPSNEIPSPSNEIPDLSNEIPESSIEIISAESQEPPGNSESAPSSGSAEEPPTNSSPDHSSDGGTVESAQTSEDTELPEIETTLGPVKGIKWRETAITAYIDIPYGKIETPFAEPAAATRWNELHEVSEHRRRCPQYIDDSLEGDLDCLTLSIFVPPSAGNSDVGDADAGGASVLFYIHDCNFHSGDPMIYGPDHLVSKGVILVLPNYRFNALGFLCLHNETALGNAGLKDLSKALEWTADNIERFGGNKDNIVVSGDGNAGALAGYLALSPKSKSHIKKVITESGSMLSHVALDRHPENTAWTLAENIRNEDRDVVLNNPFTEASLELIVKAAKGMRFNPCIEHNEEPFIGVSPWALLQNGEIDITFMIGSASRAGAHQALAISDTFVDDLNQDYGLVLPNDLLFQSKSDRDLNALKVKTQYFGTNPISREQLKEIALWFTDATYICPMLRSARSLVQAGATVYLYEFDFVGDLNRELISLGSPEVEGAARSDIVGYLFTQDGLIPAEDSTEKQVIDRMVEFWVNFINTGVPKATGVEEWSALVAGAEAEEEFLHITADPEPLRGVHVSRLQVWSQLYRDFFIERNAAAPASPPNYFFITIIFCLTTTKLDYQ